MTPPTSDYRNPARREHFVYRAYDKAGAVLYIGCTMRPQLRWKEHRSWGGWAHLVRRWRVSGPYNYDVARDIEYLEIVREDPPYNAEAPSAPQRKERRAQLIDQLEARYLEYGLEPHAAVLKAAKDVNSMRPGAA